jgi:hypothetical protein
MLFYYTEKTKGIIPNESEFRGLKKVSPNIDNHFEGMLGYCENFFRVSNSLQKMFGMTAFFQCIAICSYDRLFDFSLNFE